MKGDPRVMKKQTKTCSQRDGKTTKKRCITTRNIHKMSKNRPENDYQMKNDQKKMHKDHKEMKTSKNRHKRDIR